jgi:Glycosyltransferase family 87
VAVLALLAFRWLDTYRYPIASPDFFVYYLAAQIGITHGWAAVYDPSVFLPAQSAVIGRPLPYLNPPELAWLVLPLSLLPYPLAAWMWKAVLVVAFAFSWYLAAPGTRMTKVLSGLAGAVLLPVFISFFFGQVSLLIVAAVALGCWLLRAGHPWLAGLALAAIFLKPQAAFLVPVALLLGGHIRTFLSWLAATAVLALAAFIAVGTSALANIAVSMRLARDVPGPIQMSLERQLPFAIGLAAVVVALAVFGVVTVRSRGAGPELPVAAGLLASMLVSPYINFYDVSGIVLAAWLILRSHPPRWQQAITVAMFVPLYLAPIAPLFTLACIGGWFGSLVPLPAVRRKRERPSLALAA